MANCPVVLKAPLPPLPAMWGGFRFLPVIFCLTYIFISPGLSLEKALSSVTPFISYAWNTTTSMTTPRTASVAPTNGLLLGPLGMPNQLLQLCLGAPNHVVVDVGYGIIKLISSVCWLQYDNTGLHCLTFEWLLSLSITIIVTGTCDARVYNTTRFAPGQKPYRFIVEYRYLNGG